MRTNLKVLAVVGLVVGGAVSANAVEIILDSAGTWSNFTLNGITGAYSFNQSETVAQPLSNTGGLPELDSLAATVSGNLSTFPNATGVAVYSNVAGTQTLTLDWTVTDQNYSTSGNDFSMDGTWVYAAGTGGYAGLTGFGTFANDQSNTASTSGFSGTVLSGTLTAVPEPASYAVLGLGALGLIRRRKSA